MEKIVRMTAEEIRRTGNLDAAIKRAQRSKPLPAPEGGRLIATGFPEFREYINRGGRPRAEDPKVNISIRLPRSIAAELRASGKGWQTRTSKYVEQGVAAGAL